MVARPVRTTGSRRTPLQASRLPAAGSNFSVANGGSGRSDMFQAGAFVRHNFDATYLTAAVAYGWQDVTTDRYVTCRGRRSSARQLQRQLPIPVALNSVIASSTPWFGGLGVSPYAGGAESRQFELPS